MKLNNYNRGQASIEYALVFAIIIIIVIAALKPNGFITKGVQMSINETVSGLENMANSVHYNVEGEY